MRWERQSARVRAHGLQAKPFAAVGRAFPLGGRYIFTRNVGMRAQEDKCGRRLTSLRGEPRHTELPGRLHFAPELGGSDLAAE